jgi:uncharacterized glyoxalase superfamily protein PhnB
MSAGYKPAGYTSVAPYLIVDGASGTIEFLKQVFGAEELRRFPDSSGKVMHAEVRVDDTVLNDRCARDADPSCCRRATSTSTR